MPTFLHFFAGPKIQKACLICGKQSHLSKIRNNSIQLSSAELDQLQKLEAWRSEITTWLCNLFQLNTQNSSSYERALNEARLCFSCESNLREIETTLKTIISLEEKLIASVSAVKNKFYVHAEKYTVENENKLKLDMLEFENAPSVTRWVTDCPKLCARLFVESKFQINELAYSYFIFITENALLLIIF